ncbi:hypothetical protein N9U66_00305 [Synechococcus sp. AH-736-M20]|nr:hypothetical protein [Synechococcus sp. AH-736-M20]
MDKNTAGICLSNPVSILQSVLNYIKSVKSDSLPNSNEISSQLKEYFVYFERSSHVLEKKTLEYCINLFSTIDHLFFSKILSRQTSEESHALLITSISNFGQLLSLIFQNYYSSDYCSSSVSNILFIVKGPFDLAHASFAKSFILGHSSCNSSISCPKFLFLDTDFPSNLNSISFSFKGMSTFYAMRSYQNLIKSHEFGTVIWLSVSQTVSLFLGSRFTERQIYWSARYRNQLFNTVDKYFFGARESKKTIQYNGVSWCYGRFHVGEWKGLNLVDLTTKFSDKSDLNWVNFIKRKKSQGFIVAATISTERKLQSEEFRNCILQYLNLNPHVYYFFTSRVSCDLDNLLKSNGLQTRFKRIDWINTMTPVVQLFDLILDSFPVGASHSLCFALNSGTPFLSMYTNENLRSSLLESLSSTLVSKATTSDFHNYGIVFNSKEYLELATSLTTVKNNQKREKLLLNQRQIVNSILNNPKGMYKDFISHILS